MRASLRAPLALLLLLLAAGGAAAKHKGKNKGGNDKGGGAAAVLGTVTTPLIASDPQDKFNTTTSGEATLADLYCQALLEGAKEGGVCLLDGGGFRANIAPGNVTRALLQAAYPRDDNVVRLSVTGAQVQAMLEHGVAGWPTSAAFPQVGRVRYGFYPYPNFGEDSGFLAKLVRAVHVDAAGTQVVGELASIPVLTLVTNEYIADGGGGYPTAGAATIPSDASRKVNDVVADYVAKAAGPLAVNADGRIVNCAEDGANALCTPAAGGEATGMVALPGTYSAGGRARAGAAALLAAAAAAAAAAL
jgi:2',3'-cyclic-nucleotide 2'-phosphodiesterase (5'-nucleotidase family)